MALTKVTGEGVGSLDSLGIGTSSPDSNRDLHIKKTGANASILIEETSTTNYGQFIELKDSTTSWFIANRYAATGSGASGFGIGTTNSGDMLQIDTNGHVTMPSQSAFAAKITSQQSNIALSSQVTVLFATELYDQNSDFNTSTYTFTAPVTGKYQLNVLMLVVNIDTVPGYYQTQLTTSNRTYYNTHDPRGYSQDLSYHNLNTSVLADMDAGDTAIVKIYQAGGTQQTDLDAESYFTGYLVC